MVKDSRDILLVPGTKSDDMQLLTALTDLKR